MNPRLEEILAANDAYSRDFGDKKGLAMRIPVSGYVCDVAMGRLTPVAGAAG